MATPTLPFIGSKISLISNAEIRYEGTLYTINTDESTIALQHVRSFGTEGRRHPEVPKSAEVYHFIIFRGKDIKELNVLSSAGSTITADPAIVTVNKTPPRQGGGKGKGKTRDAPAQSWWDRMVEPAMKGKGKGAGKGAPAKGAGKGKGKGAPAAPAPTKGAKGAGKAKGNAKGNATAAWPVAAKGSGKGAKGTGKGAAPAKGKGAGKADKPAKGAAKGGKADKPAKGAAKGGKADKPAKGAAKGGKGGKADKPAKGKGKGAANDESKKTKSKSRSRSGGGGGGGGGSAPVGVALPTKGEKAEKVGNDFDFTSSNQTFTKSGAADVADVKEGYNKTSSFFDSISREATGAKDPDAMKVDRQAQRQLDRDTFGDAALKRPFGRRGGRFGGRGRSKR